MFSLSHKIRSLGVLSATAVSLVLSPLVVSQGFAENIPQSLSQERSAQASGGASVEAAGEQVEWQKGWIAQSFDAPIGVDLPRPGERPIDRWIDPGNGLFSTDYLFAHSGTNTYLYNAGILRTGSLKVTKPGSYRINGFMDRYISFGAPQCRMRLALDGVTIIDNKETFKDFGGQKDGKPQGAAIAQNQRSTAGSYKESSGFTSPVFEITEPGMYRLDFWSVCRDIDNTNAIYKLANEQGLRTTGRSCGRGICTDRIKTFYDNDSLALAAARYREGVNPLKQAIAENHGTLFDFTLENMDSGRIARITGDSIYHNKAHAPANRLGITSVTTDAMIPTSPWYFTAIRGDMKSTVVQGVNTFPQFGDMVEKFEFLPTFMEARKRIRLGENGLYGFSFGYEPLRDQSINEPKSEATDIYLEGTTPDGKRVRIKLMSDTMKGMFKVGELKFMYFNLPAGEYDFVFLRDVNKIERDRYGNIISDPMKNSNIAIRIKTPSSERFEILK